MDDSLNLRVCEFCGNKAKAENVDIVLHNSVAMTFSEMQFSLLPPGVVWGGLYRTLFLKNYNIKFNESTMYGEDQVFNLICNPKANKIVCFSENLYKYRTDNVYNSGIPNDEPEPFKKVFINNGKDNDLIAVLALT
mgnify:CR=1 FL=1